MGWISLGLSNAGVCTDCRGLRALDLTNRAACRGHDCFGVKKGRLEVGVPTPMRRFPGNWHRSTLKTFVATRSAVQLGRGPCASTPSSPTAWESLEWTGSDEPSSRRSKGSLLRPRRPSQASQPSMGAITLPKYLDRPQIVTRASGHQLVLGEFDRWAEPLPDNVARVLAENLARLIPTDHILLNPWPRSAALDYQVGVEVWQFDGELGGESALLALWSLLDEAERPLLTQRASLTSPVGGRDYQAMVQALNQMLEALSRDIAAAIQRLASPAAARE